MKYYKWFDNGKPDIYIVVQHQGGDPGPFVVSDPYVWNSHYNKDLWNQYSVGDRGASVEVSLQNKHLIEIIEPNEILKEMIK